MGFIDRRDAGVQLGLACERFAHERPVVLGLVRGGIPVAYEVARLLNAPLDALGVRKLGMPSQPELALGAVSEGDAQFIDPAMQSWAGVTDAAVDRMIADARIALAARMTTVRNAVPLLSVSGRTVIVVDDGIATGATMRAALQTIRSRGAARIVLAVPVASREALTTCTTLVDETVCLLEPAAFGAVGEFYRDFPATTDAEMIRLLREQRAVVTSVPVAHAVSDITVTRDILIPVEGPLQLPSTIIVPDHPRAIVVFAHGAGSNHNSPRNRHVAEALAAHGYAALLMDLLSPDETLEHEKGFAFPLLGSRVRAALDWISTQPALTALPIVLYGASTGAAVALLVAAADRRVAAVVSRGGRGDLVANVIDQIHQPCLFLVGGSDDVVLDLTQPLVTRLGRRATLEVIPGAGHLFEEPGTLDDVCRRTDEWLAGHLAPVEAGSPK